MRLAWSPLVAKTQIAIGRFVRLWHSIQKNTDKRVGQLLIAFGNLLRCKKRMLAAERQIACAAEESLGIRLVVANDGVNAGFNPRNFCSLNFDNSSSCATVVGAPRFGVIVIGAISSA